MSVQINYTWSTVCDECKTGTRKYRSRRLWRIARLFWVAWHTLTCTGVKL